MACTHCVSGAQMCRSDSLDTPTARNISAHKVTAFKALRLLLEVVPNLYDVDTVVAPAVVAANDGKIGEVREIAVTCIINVLYAEHHAFGFALETCVALVKGPSGKDDSGRKARIISKHSVVPLVEIWFDAFATMPIGKQVEEDPRKGNLMSKCKREMW